MRYRGPYLTKSIAAWLQDSAVALSLFAIPSDDFDGCRCPTTVAMVRRPPGSISLEVAGATIVRRKSSKLPATTG